MRREGWWELDSGGSVGSFTRVLASAGCLVFGVDVVGGWAGVLGLTEVGAAYSRFETWVAVSWMHFSVQDMSTWIKAVLDSIVAMSALRVLRSSWSQFWCSRAVWRGNCVIGAVMLFRRMRMDGSLAS